MTDKLLKVVYDVDNVLWPLNRRVFTQLGLDYRKDVNYNVQLNPLLNAAQQAAVLDAFHQATTFAAMHFYPGAKEILQAESLGATIRIHSHCYTAEIAELKRAQIQKILPQMKPAFIKMSLITNNPNNKQIDADASGQGTQFNGEWRPRMSKKSAEIDSAAAEIDVAELSQALIKKDHRIAELEQRLSRIEKRTKSNERFARTLSECLGTQVYAIDAVAGVLRRSLREDAVVQDELMAAIKDYDKHKFRRWLSGFCGVLLWVGSVTLAVFVGAFVYWIFSGQ